MSQPVHRKRYVNPQHEALNSQQSRISAPVVSGKRLRWFQKAFIRRVRLLFTLLRRYPIVVLFLFLIVWKGLRLVSTVDVTHFPSVFKTRFQLELAKKVMERFRNEQLIANFGQQHLQRVSHLRDTTHGIFMDVQLKGEKAAIVKLSTRHISTDAPQSEATPQVYKLAELLRLHHAFAKSYRIRIPVVLHEPVADRHTMKALCRACGFRSPSKVPDGATVVADFVITEPKSLRFMSVLRTPTIEPYDWTSNLPTSRDCGKVAHDQTPNNVTQRQCQRLTEVMIVMYLAGCAPPRSDAFADWYADDDPSNATFQMAFPGGCFGKYEDNSILLDILSAYIRRTCSLPAGLIHLSQQLSDSGWGVGRRVELLKKQLVFLDSSDDGCRSQRWNFYERSVG